MTLQLEIVTPEKVVFKDEVDQVTLPTILGEITVLPAHATLLTQASSGEIRIKKNTKEFFLALTGGFIEVNNNKVTVLADYAVRSEEVEIEKAQEAHKRAQKLLDEKISTEDFAAAQAAFRRSLLELKVARRRKITL